MFLFIGRKFGSVCAHRFRYQKWHVSPLSLCLSHTLSVYAIPVGFVRSRCDTISRLSRIDCVHQEIDRSFGFDVCKSHVVYICNFLHSDRLFSLFFLSASLVSRCERASPIHVYWIALERSRIWKWNEVKKKAANKQNEWTNEHNWNKFTRNSVVFNANLFRCVNTKRAETIE